MKEILPLEVVPKIEQLEIKVNFDQVQVKPQIGDPTQLAKFNAYGKNQVEPNQLAKKSVFKKGKQVEPNSFKVLDFLGIKESYVVCSLMIAFINDELLKQL